MLSNQNSINPVEAGFNPELLAKAARILDSGVGEHLYPGGVLWVGRRGITALVHSSGHTDYKQTVRVDENTLYDIASLTKPIATASTILLLSSKGILSLNQSVADFFPACEHLENVTIHQLLAHTSGLPAWKDLYSNKQNRQQAIKELLETPLENKPGTQYNYSCLGYIMLSLIAEIATGESFGSLVFQYVFEPLGMLNTIYNPGDECGHIIAATGHCPFRNRVLVGEVHDANAYALGGVSGNAGLFSTATDLAIFCNIVTIASRCKHYIPFDSIILRQMMLNVLPEELGGQTYGWFTFPNNMMPGKEFVSKSAVGHTGFTGTAIIVDPQDEMYCILLTNRVCNVDDGLRFRMLRRSVFNAVMSAIVC